jgi:hypothetical protein
LFPQLFHGQDAHKSTAKLYKLRPLASGQNFPV